MRRLILAVALLAGCGQAFGQSTAPGVSLVGRHVWVADGPAFGGMSGIEMSDDGTRFHALSDHGTLWQGRIRRDGGVIVGLDTVSATTLSVGRGNAGRRMDDSEGLAIGPDGRIYVSFEGYARVAIYPDVTRPPVTIPRPREFDGFQVNASLEALALGPDGALYTLPERSGRQSLPFPMFRLLDDAWTVPFSIPRDGAFLPVGADIGPDGLFYLLERDFAGIGFRSRVRRFDMTGQNGETLLETGIGVHDNLEGISVWREDGGAIRMTLIADDNFKFFQSTELVEYRITD
ncbi:esterase-like activity of phytase family protein [Loktanella sp. DJP18]|uniref:esterase-like activity of phytase family protein n=1 Tax=Loktanella sp. DJP18 TaxID=3409788 RepID=UPI003BB7F2EF